MLASCKSALNSPVLYSTGRSEAVVLVLSFNLCCFVVYSTRRIVLIFAWCYFVLVIFNPLSIAITLLRGNLSAFCTFVLFALVWFCLFLW